MWEHARRRVPSGSALPEGGSRVRCPYSAAEDGRKDFPPRGRHLCMEAQGRGGESRSWCSVYCQTMVPVLSVRRSKTLRDCALINSAMSALPAAGHVLGGGEKRKGEWLGGRVEEGIRRSTWQRRRHRRQWLAGTGDCGPRRPEKRHARLQDSLFLSGSAGWARCADGSLTRRGNLVAHGVESSSWSRANVVKWRVFYWAWRPRRVRY